MNPVALGLSPRAAHPGRLRAHLEHYLHDHHHDRKGNQAGRHQRHRIC
ncbi:hypothetical protein ACFPRL_01880 [Pseudoclavibacter helvolus]